MKLFNQAVMLALVGSVIAGSSSGQRQRKPTGKRVMRQPVEEQEVEPVKSAFDLTNMQAELKKLAQMISNAASPNAAAAGEEEEAAEYEGEYEAEFEEEPIEEMEEEIEEPKPKSKKPKKSEKSKKKKKYEF